MASVIQRAHTTFTEAIIITIKSRVNGICAIKHLLPQSLPCPNSTSPTITGFNGYQSCSTEKEEPFSHLSREFREFPRGLSSEAARALTLCSAFTRKGFMLALILQTHEDSLSSVHKCFIYLFLVWKVKKRTVYTHRASCSHSPDEEEDEAGRLIRAIIAVECGARRTLDQIALAYRGKRAEKGGKLIRGRLSNRENFSSSAAEMSKNPYPIDSAGWACDSLPIGVHTMARSIDRGAASCLVRFRERSVAQQLWPLKAK